MKILIAGAGKVGYNIAKNLMVKHDVIIVDKNEKAIKEIEENLDVLALLGNIEDQYVLQNLQSKIDLFIGVTDVDEVNLLSSLIIDTIVNVDKKIIRLKNSFFENAHIKDRLSINEMIFPYIEAAQTFKYLIDFPHIRNVKTFKHTKALLVSALLPEDFEMEMVEDFWRKKTDQRLVVTGIERDGKFFIPQNSEMLIPKDLVYFFAFPISVLHLHEELYKNYPNSQIKNCMILGANPLGVEIAKVLDKKGLNIQIVDHDIKQCMYANKILKDRVTVLKSSYESEQFLKTNASKIDFFISAIEHDEYNITQCMMAKQYGIKKVVGINNNHGYSSLMRSLGIEVVRGAKIKAYHSILEIINSSDVTVQKNFCGGMGVVLLRKISHDFEELPCEKLIIPSKLKLECQCYLVRKDKIFSFAEVSTLQKDDFILILAPETLKDKMQNWLNQVF